MQKIPPKVSTVASLQRRLDEMELDSAGLPSISSSLNDMFLSINDKADQQKSIEEVASYTGNGHKKSIEEVASYTGNGHKKSLEEVASYTGGGHKKNLNQVPFYNAGGYQQGITSLAFFGGAPQTKFQITDRDRRQLQSNIREIERMSKAYDQKKRMQTQMRGGNPPNDVVSNRDDVVTTTDVSSIMSVSSKFMTLSSVSKSTIGVPSKPRQFIADWRLGQELFHHGSIRLEALFAEHAHIGCSICSGFGHSKSKCMTFDSLKLIYQKQPMFVSQHAIAMDILKKRKGVYRDFWLYGDIIVNGCKKQRENAMNEGPEMKNLRILCTTLTTQIMTLYQKRCLYCDGWGHLGSDKKTVKLGKRTFVPQEHKKEQIGKHTFVTYEDRCPTKQSLELSMIGFPQFKDEYVEVINQVRATVGDEYKQAKENFDKQMSTENWLRSSEEIAQYYNKRLLFVPGKTKVVVEGEQKYPKDVAYENQTKRAIDFEKQCAQREQTYLNLPTTEEDVLQQEDDYMADNDLSKSVTLDQINIASDNRLALKGQITKKNWRIYKRAFVSPENLFYEPVVEPNFFPYIVRKKNKKGNQNVSVAALAILLDRLGLLIQDFRGFGKITTFKDLDSLANFYFTFKENIKLTLAALFKEKSYFLAALHMYNWMKAEIGNVQDKEQILRLLDAGLLDKYTRFVQQYGLSLTGEGYLQYGNVMRRYELKVQQIAYQLEEKQREQAEKERKQAQLEEQKLLQQTQEIENQQKLLEGQQQILDQQQQQILDQQQQQQQPQPQIADSQNAGNQLLSQVEERKDDTNVQVVNSDDDEMNQVQKIPLPGEEPEKEEEEEEDRGGQN